MDLKHVNKYDRHEEFEDWDFSDISIESLGAHLIFGDVDEHTMKDASEFILKANQLYRNKEISFFINTLGGNCYDGFALIDLMQISNLPIKTVGLGNIVSMGVLILTAGHKGRRIMTRNTQVMAHQFSSTTEGKFHEVMADHRAQLYLKRQFIEHFRRHSTMDEQQIEDVLFDATDRWLSPSECKKYGLIDHVVDELPEFNLELPSRQRGVQRRASRSRRLSQK